MHARYFANREFTVIPAVRGISKNSGDRMRSDRPMFRHLHSSNSAQAAVRFDSLVINADLSPGYLPSNVGQSIGILVHTSMS